ncbi:MAG: glycosyltransferase [Chloroflexota bacterium]|nr:glycosyltransferase [Chloroflexota bacterium]
MYNILYPVNELKIGGAEQQLLELVRGLDKSRFRPIVAPLYPGGALDAEFRAVPGVKVIDLHRKGKYDFSTFWRIASLLRKERIDLVQPFLSPATLFGLLPAMLVGTSAKVVTERCGVRRVRGLGYKLYRTIEDWLSRYADMIIPNSVAGQDLLLQRGLPATKIRVIYNGINLQRLRVNPTVVAGHRARLGVPQGGAVVGILAGLTRPKGHDTFLRAAARINSECPHVRYAIVGDGPLREELETLASDLGLQERVVFFGYQRGVADLLATCDMVVSASRDNEGCSNSVLEAMALGVPVIATDIGGNRELVQDGVTGRLVPVGDHKALATKILAALSEEAETRAVVERAKRMIESRFALERMVRDYEELYTALAQVKPSGALRREVI